MAEKETVFSSKIKYNGLFSFKDFYKFCFDWLEEETGLTMKETIYNEKISGNSKEVRVEWKGKNDMTDYFRFEIKVEFIALGLSEVEIEHEGAKIKTNKGAAEVKVKGTLVRDYDGKFETSAFNKTLRSMYEKWVIPSRIDEYIAKIAGDCDEFLGQAKAYLDLEGKR